MAMLCQDLYIQSCLSNMTLFCNIGQENSVDVTNTNILFSEMTPLGAWEKEKGEGDR